MKSLYHFIEQAEQTPSSNRVSDDAVTVFGRHNPPHLGHKLTLDRAHSIAGSIGDKSPADQKFYTSRSHDPKKNPLPFEMKVNFLQKMFPQHAEKWDTNPENRTILDAARGAHQQGYKNFHFVGGGDRKQGMEDLLRKYNGKEYEFDNIYSHSAGERDDDGTGDDLIAKLSASKQRGFADKDDFESFLQGLPVGPDFEGNFEMEDAKSLFSALKMFGQKNESWENDKEQIREMYRSGMLYHTGDMVESLTSGLIGKVHRCGTNHLICVSEDGIMFKNFVYDVQSI